MCDCDEGRSLLWTSLQDILITENELIISCQLHKYSPLLVAGVIFVFIGKFEQIKMRELVILSSFVTQMSHLLPEYIHGKERARHYEWIVGGCWSAGHKNVNDIIIMKNLSPSSEFQVLRIPTK